jgi:hypothetical protein
MTGGLLLSTNEELELRIIEDYGGSFPERFGKDSIRKYQFIIFSRLRSASSRPFAARSDG